MIAQREVRRQAASQPQRRPVFQLQLARLGPGRRRPLGTRRGPARPRPRRRGPPWARGRREWLAGRRRQGLATSRRRGRAGRWFPQRCVLRRSVGVCCYYQHAQEMGKCPRFAPPMTRDIMPTPPRVRAGATAGLSSSVGRRGGSALLDKPAVAPDFHKIRHPNSEIQPLNPGRRYGMQPPIHNRPVPRRSLFRSPWFYVGAPLVLGVYVGVKWGPFPREGNRNRTRGALHRQPARRGNVARRSDGGPQATARLGSGGHRQAGKKGSRLLGRHHQTRT